MLYDRYFSNEIGNVDLLEKILPKKKLEIIYNTISDNDINILKQRCDQWKFTKNPLMKNRHDRYLIVDEKLEIILSSGFDHLNETSSDFTYVIRPIQKPRF